MGSRYLTDLADVVRAAGLTVHEEDGWQTRARSSGGFDSGRPTHVFVHHTASNPGSDGQADVDYIAYHSDIAPVSNLYLSRAGDVWVIAAGATNTEGSGHDSWGGGIPDDSANTYSISIEAANNGVGEPWSDIQQAAYLILVAALCATYGIAVAHVRAHFEWTDRKIDPAGESLYAAGGDSWNMDAFRADVATGADIPPPTPGPTPPPTDWVCPPFPGVGDYGCSSSTCLAWQDAMILNGIISDNPANRDGVWGNGMHNACLNMQRSWGWGDADGIGGQHTWPHLRSRGVAPCPTCGG